MSIQACSKIRTSRLLFRGSLVLCATTAAALQSASAGTSKVVTFKVQGAGYTDARSINSAGAVAGICLIDNKDAGFLRDADGTISTFQPNGGGNSITSGINDEGQIVGFYEEKNCCNIHGFIRQSDGTFTFFDVSGSSQTYAGVINSKGEVAGLFAGSPNGGFLRRPSGKITIFYISQSLNGPGVSGINSSGTIVGSYNDTNSVAHGYLRKANGTITVIDAPGAGDQQGQGTFGDAINDTGTITGYYVDSGGVIHAFVRAVDGTFSEFDAPGAGKASGEGTLSYSITKKGAIAGGFVDTNNVDRGFVRAANGSITEFSCQGKAVTGTYVASINNSNQITGSCDLQHRRKGTSVGFLRYSKEQEK